MTTISDLLKKASNTIAAIKKPPAPICNKTSICFSNAMSHLKTNPYDSKSDNICDIADGANKLATRSDYYTDKEATQLKEECYRSYLSTKLTCSEKDQRYKSRFTNATPRASSLFIDRSAPSKGVVFSHIKPDKENYSTPGVCVDACAAAEIGTDMYNACKDGSIAYCSSGDNIISDICSEDKLKYTELVGIQDKWCQDNASKSTHKLHCPIIPEEPVVVDTSSGINIKGNLPTNIESVTALTSNIQSEKDSVNIIEPKLGEGTESLTIFIMLFVSGYIAYIILINIMVFTALYRKKNSSSPSISNKHENSINSSTGKPMVHESFNDLIAKIRNSNRMRKVKKM